jgi:hypothetical protein
MKLQFGTTRASTKQIMFLISLVPRSVCLRVLQVNPSYTPYAQQQHHHHQPFQEGHELFETRDTCDSTEDNGEDGMLNLSQNSTVP